MPPVLSDDADDRESDPKQSDDCEQKRFRQASHGRFSGASRHRFLWNDKPHFALVEFAMIRVHQFEEHFVRTGRKTEQDDSIATRLRPDPQGATDSRVDVSDAWGVSQRGWAEHRQQTKVLRAIMDDNHAARGERFRERRIDKIFGGGSSLVSGLSSLDHSYRLAFVRRR